MVSRMTDKLPFSIYNSCFFHEVAQFQLGARKIQKMGVGSALLLVAFNVALALGILLTIISLSVPKWAIQADGKNKGVFDCIFLSENIVDCDNTGENNVNKYN